MLNISEKNGFVMPLEVEVVTREENITKRIFVNGSALLKVKIKEEPLKVILDPNDWMINANGSDYRVNWESFMLEKVGRNEKEIGRVKIVTN